MTVREDGAWVETLALFQAVREGDQQIAAQLLRTTSDPGRVIFYLLRLLGVYLRGEDAEKLDRFIAASHRAGPPPALDTGPRPPG